VITVATLFWTPNAHSHHFSTMYNETWVERLYRGFQRNLTRPFRFVCFTERDRTFHEPIAQERIEGEPTYATCIQPYRLDEPMILVGLDTIITGNIDHLADYCLTADVLAVPRDPIFTDTVCNGVALVPGGMKARMFDRWQGENDMDWIRANPHAVIDDLWPGQVNSYRCHVKAHGLGDSRIVYFHGKEKMDDPYFETVGWVRRHWQ